MPKAKKSETDKPVKLKDLKSKVAKPEKEKKARKKDKAIEAPSPVVAVEKPAKLGRKPAAAKALVAKVAKPKPVAAPEPEIVITNDDIALRAYFIAERRQAMGWPGDSSSDWVEAESQLRAEAKRKAKK